ncbi:hypothetical protein [Phytohalomonas tamaricis]|uniref:hypothetical protein n=1 Tax=Phytohalomonas tamaricis TaxID=2081032 RepID=UPI000D0BE23B|nr:hypothetical protein [Phytohalomonas tamaricis]
MRPSEHPERNDKRASIVLVDEQVAPKHLAVPAYGRAGYSDRLDYIAKVILFKTGKRLRWVRDGQIVSEKVATFADLKRREQRVEWRRRQEYYEQHGRAPGPTIIKLKGLRAKR